MARAFEEVKNPSFVLKCFLITILLLGVFPAFADECPVGEYWVNPHFRNGYIRYDGVVVRATDVRGHCRTNPRGYEKWHQRLSNERPEIWNFKNEKSKNQKKEFAEASDWMNVYNYWIPKDDKVFLEEDSKKSVDEDFANHIEHYLFKNESLKKKSPHVYKWIDKTFGKDFKLQEKK